MAECTSLHRERRQPRMAASGFQGWVEVNWGMVGLPDRRNSESIDWDSKWEVMKMWVAEMGWTVGDSELWMSWWVWVSFSQQWRTSKCSHSGGSRWWQWFRQLGLGAFGEVLNACSISLAGWYYLAAREAGTRGLLAGNTAIRSTFQVLFWRIKERGDVRWQMAFWDVEENV